MLPKNLAILLLMGALVGCNEAPVTKTKMVYITYPEITDCEEYSLEACSPRTNGDLFLCAVELERRLKVCSVTARSYNEWLKASKASRIPSAGGK